jgi:hypothetical protein
MSDDLRKAEAAYKLASDEQAAAKQSWEGLFGPIEPLDPAADREALTGEQLEAQAALWKANRQVAEAAARLRAANARGESDRRRPLEE